MTSLFDNLDKGDTQPKEATLEGTLERIVFQNQENHWTVGRLETSTGDLVTAVGTLVGVVPGTALSMRGNWIVDKKYGRQFKVESFQTQTPETALGIERYLASGLIPGVGPELARRMVERFGVDTLRVIDEQPERLVEVDGLGPSRRENIRKAWQGQRDIQEVMVFLRGHDIPSGYAVRIYKRYGKDAVRVVKTNPYRLALDVWGIGFRTADAIAQKLGMGKTAPERVESGILHSLGELTRSGHLHAPEQHVIDAAVALLEVDTELVREAVDRLVQSMLLVRETLPQGIVLSLTWAYECETAVARELARLIAEPLSQEPRAGAVQIDLTHEAPVALTAQQLGAVRAAATDKCLVITGGPGVGKTTLVRAITAMLLAAKRPFALAAPTGRAAKRLAESTGVAATTLHRLLEFQPQSGRFDRNRERLLEVDCLIVDEASMLDIQLFRSLLEAMPSQAQLVLVGDVDQLPSVGPGAVLADVIRSGKVTVIALTEIFRQASQSRIIVNAHRINAGQMPEFETPKQVANKDIDFFFVEREDPIAARDTLLEMVASRIPQRFGFDSKLDIQVLTPMHRGELGTRSLNEALQKALNPEVSRSAALSIGDRSFRTGDKVMQVRNDYDRDVWNGDVGIVQAVDRENGELIITLHGGRPVAYKNEELDQLVHAYAISIHKSQGSEYPAVVIPLLTQHYMMLERNLLYTAITRGRKLVVVVGSQRALSMAVKRASGKARWTYLSERIRQLSL